MQKHYYQAIIPRDLYNELKSQFDLQKQFNIAGIEEFSMEESEVDSLLGERSYSGGDVPSSVIDEVDYFQELTEKSDVKFYFNEAEDCQKFIGFIASNNGTKLTYEKIEMADWNEEWKKSYAPIEINSDSILIPSWYEESDYAQYKNCVKIYPGMGFGTGSHETTYLCLKFLVNQVNLDEVNTCMDFGCGSGILAIYLNALKKQNRTDYYDIDPLALDNTKVNIEINNLEHEHNLLLTADREDFLKEYDLVFANILLNVLIAEANDIQRISKKYLIISGLLNGQETEIIKEYTDFECKDILRKNDWCALLMVRK
tara:strand:- start:128961 stop:129902 length:942 start_codon:yes stop_codon:yes gene_type:complete